MIVASIFSFGFSMIFFLDNEGVRASLRAPRLIPGFSMILKSHSWCCFCFILKNPSSIRGRSYNFFWCLEWTSIHTEDVKSGGIVRMIKLYHKIQLYF